MTDNVFEGLTKEDLLNPTIKPMPSEFYVFYSLRLAARKQITMYTGGASITIPEIQIDNEAWSRNGIKEGGNNTAYFLEVTGYKEGGEEYKFVEVLTVNPDVLLTQEQVDSYPPFFISEDQAKQMKEKGETRFSLFNNFYAEQFANLDDMNEVGMGKQIHIKARKIQYRKEPKIDKDTEEQTLTDDGKPAFWRDQYYTNWERFDTVEELLAAKKEHWGSNDNSNNGVSPSFKYPNKWGDSVPGMLDWLREQLGTEGVDIKAIAIQGSLTPEHTKDYKEIVVSAWESLPEEKRVHLTSVLDKPLPMIEW